MQQVTTNQFFGIVDAWRACQAVSIDIETEPRMKKTGNPHYGQVTKSVTLNGLVGFSYGNAVNNQAGREDHERLDFHPEARKWGTLSDNKLWVFHKEKTYLQILVKSAGTAVYKVNGEIVDKAEIDAWLYKSKKPHTQDHIDGHVVLRDVNITNIKQVRMLGDEYVIGDQTPTPDTKVEQVKTPVTPVEVETEPEIMYEPNAARQE